MPYTTDNCTNTSKWVLCTGAGALLVMQWYGKGFPLKFFYNLMPSFLFLNFVSCPTFGWGHGPCFPIPRADLSVDIFYVEHLFSSTFLHPLINDSVLHLKHKSCIWYDQPSQNFRTRMKLKCWLSEITEKQRILPISSSISFQPHLYVDTVILWLRWHIC